MLRLAIPTTVFNYPIYLDGISCHVFLYTPQVPATLSAQAVSSCHKLLIVSSSAQSNISRQ